MKEEDYVPLPPPEPGYTWLVFPNTNTVVYVKEEDILEDENGQITIKAGTKAVIMDRKLKSENIIPESTQS